MDTGILVPIILFLTTGGVLGFMLLTRHKERMSLIEKGLRPEEIKAMYERGASRPPNPLTSLKWGIILLCIGIAIVIGMYLHATYNVEGGIFPGLIALFGGLGLILYYLIANKKLSQ